MNTRSRRNNVSSVLAPVAVLPVIVEHHFEESGGTISVKPPSLGAEMSAPKMASLNIQYASSTPAFLRVVLTSAAGIQLETMPLTASTTTKTLKLRMPRHVDADMSVNASFIASGPVTISGRINFTQRGTVDLGSFKFAHG